MNVPTQLKLREVFLALSIAGLLVACSKSEKTDENSTDKSSSTSTTESGGTTSDKAAVTSPEDKNKVKISLDKLPETMSICTVGNKSISVAEYRRMLKVQQIEMGKRLSVDPAFRMQLTQKAKEKGITLTADEKKKVVENWKDTQKKSGKPLKDLLKEANVTEQQLDEEILSNALAMKVLNMAIEENLLAELVKRELLSQNAINAGKLKEAEKRYDQLSKSADFPKVKEQLGLSPEIMKAEIIKSELAKISLEDMNKEIKVTPEDVKSVYDKNKEAFKHGERIRVSTILIAAPEKDAGNIPSVRNQLLKANSKLAGAELDAAVAKILEDKRQTALIMLGQAQAGSDFAKLANEKSDDINVQVRKTGGDIGWVEKKNLRPELMTPIWNLKAGQVLPQLVKSEVGYNIYKVTGKEAAGYTPEAQVKPLLEALARQQKLEVALNKFLQEKQKVVPVKLSEQFQQVTKTATTGNKSS